MAINFDKGNNESDDLSFDDLGINFDSNGDDDADSLDLKDFSFDIASSTSDADINADNDNINFSDTETPDLGEGSQGFQFDIDSPAQTGNTDNVADAGFNTDGVNIGGANVDTHFTDVVKTKVADLPPDLFSLFLGLALVAIIIASVLLYLDVSSYGPEPLSGLPRL
ncbi:MAG: hypothetical protein LBK06_05405 [Planctomycetaceae bacterium]|jgi:hypothetical protein|nr:hypothetical protein [Planctomycetaceae bacterium]